MTIHKFFLFLSIFLMWREGVSGTEIQDTIVSASKDYVYIGYDVKENNGKVTVSFSEVRKRLGLRNKERYSKLENVCVLFFDRGGDYKDKFTSDIGTEPLRVISDEFRYFRSEDGYVRLDSRTVLSLELLANQSVLSLPIYLAYYEGKRRYKIFAKCENLNIRLKKRGRGGVVAGTMETVRKEIPVTEEVEVESDITPKQEAVLLVGNLKEYLGQGELSLAELESLGRRVDRLRDLEVIVTDNEVRDKIKDVLQTFDQKMQVAREQHDSEDKAGMEIASRQEKEQQAKEELAYVRERLEKSREWSEDDLGELKSCSNNLRRKAHSIDNPELAQEMKDTADKCDNEIKRIEEAGKRRSLFMIVGGILLGILFFVGNQLVQHFRNLRNMKSMEDVQNKIAKRAEDEALRRAQNTARSKVNRIQAQVSQKSHDAVKTRVNNTVKNIGKNTKKNVSI